MKTRQASPLATSFSDVALSFWVIATSVIEVYLRATYRHDLLTGLTKLGRSHWAMVLGHIGLAMVVIGISATQNYKIEKDVRMLPGDEVIFADYTFKKRYKMT